MVSTGFPMINVFEQTRSARWSIALGFVALWHAALQLVAELWFGTAPGVGAQLLDLAMHLVLGALFFAHAWSLTLFVPAVGLLMVVLHLGNAAKIAILGGPVMSDDVAALRSLFLILQGWQLVVATLVVVLATGLSLAALRPSFSRAWPASVVLGAVVLGLWLAPAVVAATLDRWVGNRLWDQRHNFESRGIVLHLVHEGARHLARRERPPSLQEVARALGDLRPAHTVEAGPGGTGGAARPGRGSLSGRTTLSLSPWASSLASCPEDDIPSSACFLIPRRGREGMVPRAGLA